MRLPDPEYALIGAVIDGRYRILRLIGRGGMGVVYEAEAVRLRRRCACKVLLPEYTRDANAIARFEREALAAARVDHPNVVKIHDTGTTRDGSGYIAMDLLRGESLDCTIRREGRLPWSRARHIALQICRALAAAHAQGVVHRDLKPENCFRITHDGDQDFIKIVDFGIAKLSDPSGADARRLTEANAILGTCSYMAHELVAGELDLCDHRVDVWAAGVVLYEMLTGTLPFQGQHPGQVFAAILNHTPMRMSAAAPGANIPEAIEEIVAKALEKRLGGRFRTIDDLAHALAGVDLRGQVMRESANPFAAELPTLLPLGDSVDGMAPTLVKVPGVRGTAGRRTEAADPYQFTEFNRGKLRAATHEHPRSQVAPGTDPAGPVAAAPRADIHVTAVVPPTRSQLHPPSPLFAAAPRQLRRWIAASALSAGAVVAGLAMLSSASVPIQPSGASMQPHTASAMDAVLAGEDSPWQGPLPAEGIVVPPSESTPPATPNATEHEGRGRETTAAPRVKPRKDPPESYADRVRRRLARVSRGPGVRKCLAAHEFEKLGANIEISAATGRVVRFTAQLLMRGSALEKCVERESRAWLFPIGGPWDLNYRASLDLKAR